jgi:DNA-binding transcriptional regulator PaaX
MYRKKSLSNVVLLALEKSVDGVVRINDFARNTGYYAYGNGWNYPLDRSALSKTLKRLRENGLVDFTSDEKIAIRLTNSGKEKAVLAKLLLGEEKWDGKWRIVMFDIPEKRRLARDILRSKLKAWGFTQYQQSVWITKKDCAKLLKDFIRQVGIKDWVKVFEAQEIDK